MTSVQESTPAPAPAAAPREGLMVTARAAKVMQGQLDKRGTPTGAIRFGVGRFNTEEEIDYVIDLVAAKVDWLREMSPLWEMVQEGIDLKSIQWEAH